MKNVYVIMTLLVVLVFQSSAFGQCQTKLNKDARLSDINEVLRCLNAELHMVQKQVRTDALPRMTLDCITTPGVVGRVAKCPVGYIVTGCTAGGNRGSYNIHDESCETHDKNTDWTAARCCKVRAVK